jgi:hypothetical protein
VRRIFAAYILLALPAIVGLMGYVAWHAPAIFSRTEAAISARAELVNFTVAREDWGNALLAVVEIMLLALPCVGLIFFVMVLVRAVMRLAWRRRMSTMTTGDAQLAAGPAAGVQPDFAPVPARQQRPRMRRAGEPISLQAAIADHLELKRRHAEGDRPARASHVDEISIHPMAL